MMKQFYILLALALGLELQLAKAQTDPVNGLPFYKKKTKYDEK